jgi:hypothetical protein
MLDADAHPRRQIEICERGWRWRLRGRRRLRRGGY